MAPTDPASLGMLTTAAAAIAFVHTVAGPDHYLPFVAMSRIGRWSLQKTTLVTLLCGLGHVMGSILLGLLGIALGVAVFRLESIESSRGTVAGWLLLAFGLVYTLYGVRRAMRNRPHTHLHGHANGMVHTHEHIHTGDHLHAHLPIAAAGGETARQPDQAAADSVQRSLTPWLLFTIFLFGPCEPLIPLVMYPAARGSWAGVMWVSVVFGSTTLATMTTIVLAARAGLLYLRPVGFERYAHAAAGMTVLMCGVAVVSGR